MSDTCRFTSEFKVAVVNMKYKTVLYLKKLTIVPKECLAITYPKNTVVYTLETITVNKKVTEKIHCKSFFCLSLFLFLSVFVLIFSVLLWLFCHGQSRYVKLQYLIWQDKNCRNRGTLALCPHSDLNPWPPLRKFHTQTWFHAIFYSFSA